MQFRERGGVLTCNCMNPGSLQTQMDALQAQLAALRQTLQQTQQALEAARRENTLLRQKLDALARRFFGKKSERLSTAQLELLLSGLAEGGVELQEEDEPPALLTPRRTRTDGRGATRRSQQGRVHQRAGLEDEAFLLQ